MYSDYYVKIGDSILTCGEERATAELGILSSVSSIAYFDWLGVPRLS